MHPNDFEKNWRVPIGPALKLKDSEIRPKKPGAPEYSRVVPHRTTDSALQCLTAQIGRDAVCSLWYGPRYKVRANWGYIGPNKSEFSKGSARVSPIRFPHDDRVTTLLWYMTKAWKLNEVATLNPCISLNCYSNVRGLSPCAEWIGWWWEYCTKSGPWLTRGNW